MAGWTRISCEERNDHYALAGESLKPISSLTDLEGSFGTAIVFTEWGRDDQDEPLLRDYRWPNDDRSCEHWFYTGGVNANVSTSIHLPTERSDT